MAEKDRIRTERYLLTLLPEEAAMLEKNSYEYGLSRADYLRKMILFGSVVGQHPVIDKEQGKKLLYEVNKIGNNINQIARNINIKKHADNEEIITLENKYYDLLELLGGLLNLDEEEWGNWQQRIYMQLQKQLNSQ